MLFPYKYINHDIEIIQNFINYIFGEIWFKANINRDYNFKLYRNKYYNKMINDLYIANSETSDKFVTLIQDIYIIFQSLSISDKEIIKNHYLTNLDINNLCENIRTIPLSYDMLEQFNPQLKIKIKNLSDLLYGSGSILTIKEIKKISNFYDHYRKFIKINKNICAFCGIEKLEVVKDMRSDYDHFLTKKTYPFIAINLHNLAPTCDKCNRKYKFQDDPLYKDNNRRKVFYPYNKKNYKINISIDINNVTDGEILADDVNINLRSQYQEEVNSWDDIYKIQNRYSTVCSVDDESINWIDSATIAMDMEDITFSEYVTIEKEKLERQKSPYFEKKFLKVPFLNACKNAGIL